MKSKTKKWKKHGEVRLNDDGSVDEIVIKNCDVHLEQMDTGVWWMGICVGRRSGKFGNRKETMHVHILNTKNRPVVVRAESDDDVISEGFK